MAKKIQASDLKKFGTDEQTKFMRDVFAAHQAREELETQAADAAA